MDEPASEVICRDCQSFLRFYFSDNKTGRDANISPLNALRHSTFFLGGAGVLSDLTCYGTALWWHGNIKSCLPYHETPFQWHGNNNTALLCYETPFL